MEQQRTQEWFEKRKGKITGSIIGAILGYSQWMSKEEARLAVLGELKFEGNIATEYGARNEKMAIIDFEMKTGLKVVETGFHVHKFHDWLGASPDGLIGDDAVIEIKCPYGLRNAESESDFKSLLDQMQYYAQVQYEMFCTDRKKAYFYQWSNHADKLEIVDFDFGFIKATLPTLKQFYDNLENDEADRLFKEYKEIKEIFEEVKEALEAHKEKIIKYAEINGKTSRAGVTVYQQKRAGTIDYRQIVEDYEIDIEPYRKNNNKDIWIVK